jgi:hypothetical protein
MDRRERRRREREGKKIREKLTKEASKESHVRHVLQSFPRVLWSLFFAGLALAGGYALFHPHVSIEPELFLNPANPFSTQFKITNESTIFSVHTLTSHCWTQSLSTSHNLSIWDPGGGSARQIQHETALLGPKSSDTIDCAPIMGGIGTYTGNITQANVVISISYQQNWWPFVQTEYYPFNAMQDSGGVSHWVHVTSFEQKPAFLK